MSRVETEIKVTDLGITRGELPLSGCPYLHFKSGLEPSFLGDRVFELDPRITVLVDVSLGLHTWSIVNGKHIVITESSVADFLREYLEENFSDELSAGGVVELCARFLEEKKIVGQEKITDLALSVAVCQKNKEELILASFGSIRVFDPDGKELISSQKPYDPLAPEEQGGIIPLFRRKGRKVATEYEIQEAKIPRGQPVLMATNGFNPKALNLSDFGRKGYPLEELNPNCFIDEALVVGVS